MYYFIQPMGGEAGPFSIEDLKNMVAKPVGIFSWETDEDWEILNQNPEVLELMLSDEINANDNRANSGKREQDNDEVEENDFRSYEDEDRDDWDAYTDGQYGDYDGPIDPELIGL